MGDSDLEWEYEYDGEQTEDFYITVELPLMKGRRFNQNKSTSIFEESAMSLASKHKRQLLAEAVARHQSKGIGRGRGKRRKTSADDDEEEEEDDQVDENNNNQPQDESTEAQDGVSGVKSSTSATSFQLVYLHTEHPLLSLDGQVFQCDWSTTIGTDMLFVKQEDELGDTVTPSLQSLKSFDNWDLVACSGARLLAQPATLKFKTSRPSNGPAAPTARRPFVQRLLEVQASKGEINPDTFVMSNDILQMSSRPAEQLTNPSAVTPINRYKRKPPRKSTSQLAENTSIP